MNANAITLVTQVRKFVAVDDSAQEFPAPANVEHPSDGVAALVRQTIPDDGQEHLFVVATDAHCKPLAVGIVATGTVDMCLISPRDIYAWALTIPCVRFVGIAHNHPSGDVTPSGPDGKGTAVVAAAGRVLGIDLLWSIVVTHLSKDWAEVKVKGERPKPEGDDAEPKRPEPEPEESDEDEPEPEPEPEPSEQMEPEESGIEVDHGSANTSPSEVTVDELKASVRKAFGLK